MSPKLLIAALLLISFSYLLCLAFGSVMKRHIIHIVAAVWLIFPNWGGSYLKLAGLPLFSYVELTGAAVILALVLRYHREVRLDKTERVVVAILFATLFIQYAFSSNAVHLIYSDTGHIPPQANIENFFRELSGLIFLLGCCYFIRTIDDAERLLKIFVAFGVLLAIELLLVLKVDFFNRLFFRFSFDEYNRFNSMALNEYIAVEIVCATAILSSLYFYQTKRKARYIFAMLISMFPIAFILKRSAILALMVAFLFYSYKTVIKRRIVFATLVAAFAAGVAVYYEPIIMYAASLLPFEFLSNRIMATASFESVYSRLGTQVRTLEVIRHTFPLGLGNDMLQYYLPLEAPRIFQINDPVIHAGYYRVASGLVPTEAHNGYLETVASYGLMGLVSLLVFIGAIVKNAVKTRTNNLAALKKDKLCYLLYALILFFGVFHIFLTYPKVYIILFLLFHLTFLLKEKSINIIPIRVYSADIDQ